MTKMQKISLAGLPSFIGAILAAFGSLATLTSGRIYLFWIIFILVWFLHYKSYAALNMFARNNAIIVPKLDKPAYRPYLIIIFVISVFVPIFTSGVFKIIFGILGVGTFWALFYLEFRVTKKEQEEIARLNPTQAIETVTAYRTIKSNFRGVFLFTLVIYFIIFGMYLLEWL